MSPFSLRWTNVQYKLLLSLYFYLFLFSLLSPFSLRLGVVVLFIFIHSVVLLDTPTDLSALSSPFSQRIVILSANLKDIVRSIPLDGMPTLVLVDPFGRIWVTVDKKIKVYEWICCLLFRIIRSAPTEVRQIILGAESARAKRRRKSGETFGHYFGFPRPPCPVAPSLASRRIFCLICACTSSLVTAASRAGADLGSCCHAAFCPVRILAPLRRRHAAQPPSSQGMATSARATRWSLASRLCARGFLCVLLWSLHLFLGTHPHFHLFHVLTQLSLHHLQCYVLLLSFNFILFIFHIIFFLLFF